MRGEYLAAHGGYLSTQELPPRARRIRLHHPTACRRGGTTSACAENTGLSLMKSAAGGNYLRVRGEYSTYYNHTGRPEELPPRARRIRERRKTQVAITGTTSACAENTYVWGGSNWGDWNYLRVRGEYIWWLCWKPWMRELPPRARRIRESCCFPCPSGGTTSACAENTVCGGV